MGTIWNKHELAVFFEAFDAYLRRQKKIADVQDAIVSSKGIKKSSPDIIASDVIVDGLRVLKKRAEESLITEHKSVEIIPDEDFSLERLIGSSNDLLSIETLELGIQVAQSVGMIETGPFIKSTGFLVGENLMMTNWHSLRDTQDALDSKLVMGWEDQDYGERKRVEKFDLNPGRFFWTNKSHDVTIVSVKNISRNGISLDNYGHLTLSDRSEDIFTGYPVNIIQHPSGERKKISMHNSNLVDLSSDPEDQKFCFYTADTLKGSSGSPVFNKNWQVIALHKCGIPHMEEGRVKLRDGSLIKKSEMEGHDADILWISNQGVRISSIVKEFAKETLSNREMENIRKSRLSRWLA